MKTILEILAAGEYSYDLIETNLSMSNTRGLWTGVETVIIDHEETIHGNKVTIVSRFLQIGATGKRVIEEFTFSAHGRNTKVTADRMIEELRKHI